MILSRSRVQKLIAEKQISINGYICKNKKIVLKQGDQVIVNIPVPISSELIAQDIPLDILYEDQYLIIINKPTNLVVHPAPGHPHGTLVNALFSPLS